MCVSGEDADRLKKEGDSGDDLANKNLSVPSEPPNNTAVLKTEKPLQKGNSSAGCVGVNAADLDHFLLEVYLFCFKCCSCFRGCLKVVYVQLCT